MAVVVIVVEAVMLQVLGLGDTVTLFSCLIRSGMGVGGVCVGT
jgi:hypothetical protein